jgi:predicted TIM-barrel fold metal-dependent hydrolase
MILDCHVHVCATTPEHGCVSARLRRRLTFRFMRWRLGLWSRDDPQLERDVEAKLRQTLDEAAPLDGAVILAFDAVYDEAGRRDDANTHLYVTNDYVWELTQRHPGMYFGASVHPYRPDAVAELERCVRRGAVLLKWLPIVQNFNPADERCFPLYEALAHHQLPLLCHTGGEKTLISLNPHVADPALLVPALERGVTVIAAHCGTRSWPGETDFLPTFIRMVHGYERLYGDTAALNMPTRSYAFDVLQKDAVVWQRLVHGSDWPVIAIPTRRIGWGRAARLLWSEKNWMRRDVLTKQQLGFDDAYWHRASTLLPKSFSSRFRTGERGL